MVVVMVAVTVVATTNVNSVAAPEQAEAVAPSTAE
jgi:hypothetical protein